MKTKIILFTFLSILNASFIISQESKPSIAVSNPHMNGLETNSEGAAKMIRLELIKLDKHVVYDEFDMNDIIKANPEFKTDCIGQGCLVKLGNAMKVDYMMSGSFDGLGNKIVLTLKIVDVKNEILFKSAVREFDDQEIELQRMIELTLKDMFQIPNQKELADRLAFKNELVTSTNVGKINNSGPRIGYGIMTGSMSEFATRSEEEGGLNIFPGVSMIGYQLEGQYVGTENFSALIEGILNVSGLEQGQFIPSITIMNGFRFGKGGWEFAFGPGFGFKKTSNGFFDTQGLFGRNGRYYSERDWNEYSNENFASDSTFFSNGVYTAPDPSDFNKDYNFEKHGDKRGDVHLNTLFVFAVGRTFRAGALNIPVNLFYSSQKGGGMAGINVGFNVQKSKRPINTNR